MNDAFYLNPRDIHYVSFNSLLPFSEIELAFLIIPPIDVLCHLRLCPTDVVPSDGFGDGGRPATELVRLAFVRSEDKKC